MYLEVDDFIDALNNLCGWPVMLLSFNLVVDILTCLIEAVTWQGQDDVLSSDIALSIWFLVQSVIWLTAIIFCCDSVVRETDELLTNCYRLEQTLPLLSKELEELDSLKKLIKNKRPKLTAAGFFEIRRSTLLSLLSTTTTYFIVALQFNSL
uniref:Gustatory receptor n=1 Tax=Anoplophora chinensis TaxID=217632 RepID=A0A2H4ZBB9_ANOCN